MLSVSLHFMTYRCSHIPLHCSSSRLFGSALPPDPSRVLPKGLASDIGDRFPQGVANPPPFPSPDGDLNPLLIGMLPQVLIRDPSWPHDSQDVPEPMIDEGLKFGNYPFSQSPCFRSIKEDGLDVGIEAKSGTWETRQ